MTQVIKDVVLWLQQWFYTEDEIDDMLADLPTGGGISSITLVPYSENPNGVICYDGGDAPTPTPVQVVDSVTLSSDVSILSAYDSDTATLTATVLDEDNQAIPNVSVEFFKGSDSLGTSTTNNNGVATKSYSANGDGDLSITAECDGITSSSLTIEDCIYYDATETSKTRSGTTIYDYWDSERFSNLPSTYSVEFDMKSTTAPVSDGEQRLYWCPTSQWTGTSTQPRNALVIGYCYTGGMKVEFGKRLNGSTSSTTNISASTNNWDTVKIVKVNTSGRCDFYINGTYRDYYTFTNMDSYTEFAITYFIWSDTTFSMKNIKIKKVN